MRLVFSETDEHFKHAQTIIRWVWYLGSMHGLVHARLACAHMLEPWVSCTDGCHAGRVQHDSQMRGKSNKTKKQVQVGSSATQRMQWRWWCTMKA